MWKRKRSNRQSRCEKVRRTMRGSTRICSMRMTFGRFSLMGLLILKKIRSRSLLKSPLFRRMRKPWGTSINCPKCQRNLSFHKTSLSLDLRVRSDIGDPEFPYKNYSGPVTNFLYNKFHLKFLILHLYIYFWIRLGLRSLVERFDDKIKNQK